MGGNGPKRLPNHDLKPALVKPSLSLELPEMSGEIGQFKMSQCPDRLQLLPHRMGKVITWPVRAGVYRSSTDGAIRRQEWRVGVVLACLLSIALDYRSCITRNGLERKV